MGSAHALRSQRSLKASHAGVYAPADNIRTNRRLSVSPMTPGHAIRNTSYATVFSVIREIEIWRAAVLMLSRYAGDAEANSFRRATELAAEGDHAGARLCSSPAVVLRKPASASLSTTWPYVASRVNRGAISWRAGASSGRRQHVFSLARLCSEPTRSWRATSPRSASRCRCCRPLLSDP